MEFKQLIQMAKSGDEGSFEQIFHMYRPLLLKHSIGEQGLDEDLFQELSRTLFACIQKFTI